jgi:hypothetical protein
MKTCPKKSGIVDVKNNLIWFIFLKEMAAIPAESRPLNSDES